MSKSIFNKRLKQSLVLVTIIFGLTFVASGKPFNAYPGSYKVKLIKVEAANIVHIIADVWAGFPRAFRVTLPDIEVPVDYPKAPACHTELVQKALQFTKDFMTNAKYIKVDGIYMENTGQQDAQTKIYTDKGSLGDALSKEGLARPDTTDAKKPWC